MATSKRVLLSAVTGIALLVLHDARAASSRCDDVMKPMSALGGFIENEGQWNPQVRYAAVFRDSTLFVTTRGMRAVIASAGDGVALDFEFPLAATSIEAGDDDAKSPAIHFLRGNDPAAFVRDAHGHPRLTLHGVGPGVDLVLHAMPTGFEWDLCVGPEVDAGALALPIRVRGADGLVVADDGSLAIATALGTLVESAPRAFLIARDGSRRATPARHVVSAPDTFSIALDTAARREDDAIVVDPVLAFSTLLGGSADEPAYGGAAFDDQGGIYVVGRTRSFDFPATLGAFDITQNGNYDIFVGKLAAYDGVQYLDFATFVGGTSDDDAFGIDLAPDGGVLVTGRTFSWNFPVTPGAYDTSYGGYYDAIVFDLKSDGSALRWSTFLGGNVEDFAYRVRALPDGTAWIGGYTASSNFPVTHGAFQKHYAGGLHDAFVAHLAADGKSLLASTLLGGAGGDYIYGLTVGDAGQACVAGYTSSSNFPITPHAFDSTFNGPSGAITFDFFVAEVDADAQHLVHSTFLGGGSHDFCFGLARLSDGSLVVGGSSETSAPFPTTPFAFDTTQNGGYDAVVARLSPKLDQLVFATYLGGHDDDAIADLAVDANDKIYCVGQSRSNDYPVTPGAVGLANAGGYDATISVLEPNGRTLVHSTYLGGVSDDFASSLGIEGAGRLYVFGETRSVDFPTTANAMDSSPNGGADAFVVRYVVPVCGNSPTAVAYGQGSAGQAGIPVLSASPNGAPFYLKVVGGSPLAPAILFFGKTPLALPFAGGTLWVAPLAVVPLGQLDLAGSLSFEGPLPSVVAECGTLVYEQVAISSVSSSGQMGYALSNGLAITLGQ